MAGMEEFATYCTLIFPGVDGMRKMSVKLPGIHYELVLLLDSNQQKLIHCRKPPNERRDPSYSKVYIMKAAEHAQELRNDARTHG